MALENDEDYGEDSNDEDYKYSFRDLLRKKELDKFENRLGERTPSLSPPLPLLSFDSPAVKHEPLTLSGDPIRTIDHILSDTVEGAALHNPLHSR